MSGHARPATLADEPSMRRLAREVPMVGPVSYCLEREPNYFSLQKLQGKGIQSFVVDDSQSGELAGLGAGIPQRRRLFGQPEWLNYAADLKVHPDHRGSGLAGEIIRMGVRHAVDHGLELGASLVLGRNAKMAAIIGQRPGALLRFHHAARIRNFTVFFGGRRAIEPGLTLRRAEVADVAQMVPLWNRLQTRRDFSPVWDEGPWLQTLAATPGLSLEDFVLAFRDGRLVGFAAAWDAQAVKQLRLLRLSPGLRAFRGLYNPVARLRRRAVIPGDGSLLPFIYLTQFCAETSSDFRGLLSFIHNAYVHERYLYFDLALDVRDPLVEALDAFRLKTQLDFELFLLLLEGRSPDSFDFTDRVAYFDMALV